MEKQVRSVFDKTLQLKKVRLNFCGFVFAIFFKLRVIRVNRGFIQVHATLFRYAKMFENHISSSFHCFQFAAIYHIKSQQSTVQFVVAQLQNVAGKTSSLKIVCAFQGR